MTTSINAQGGMVCGRYEEIVGQLKKKHGEETRSFGIQRGRGVVEQCANLETGSWTIIVTDVNKKTCLIAAGEDYVESLSRTGEES